LLKINVSFRKTPTFLPPGYCRCELPAREKNIFDLPYVERSCSSQFPELSYGEEPQINQNNQIKSIKQNYRLFPIKTPSFSLRYARSLAKNKIKGYFHLICQHKDPHMEFKNPSLFEEVKKITH